MSEMEDATDFTIEFVNSLRQVISPEELLDLSMSLCERDVKNILCTKRKRLM